MVWLKQKIDDKFWEKQLIFFPMCKFDKQAAKKHATYKQFCRKKIPILYHVYTVACIEGNILKIS